MTGFFDRMLGRSGKEGSGAIAKSRLEVVLVHDRTNLSPERLRELKEELLAVIAKYVPIDRDSINIAIQQPDRNSSLLAVQIPFGKGKPPGAAALDDYTEDDDLTAAMHKLADDSEEPTDSKLPVEPEAAVSDAAAESSAPEEKPEQAADTPPEKQDDE
jgi:cell division topological specificity factor